MLAYVGAELPARLPILSPWVDADFGFPASKVAEALAAQKGRRVVETYTLADGFPIWEGVAVIAVYRHSLDVFFYLRKHTANRSEASDDDLYKWPVPSLFRAYVSNLSDCNNFGQETLMTMAIHYANTVLSDRLPDLKVFHYSDMVRDGRRTVEALVAAAGIEASARVIDKVTKATAFRAMKASGRHGFLEK